MTRVESAPTSADATAGSAYVEQEAVGRASARAHFGASLVPVVLGLVCLVYAVRLSVGDPTNPGPGMWPAVASLLLVGTGLWSMAFERATQGVERITRGSRDVALGVVSLGAFVLLFERVGFEVPTMGLFVFWLKVLGKEPWRPTVLVSVLSTAAFYIVFVVLLGVPLPRLLP